MEKQKIVELAKRYDVYIVEDDYMGDFAKSNDLPLHYYDTTDHVIYLKSFSMTLFPALRLGTLILPQLLTKTFLDYKQMIDYDTNLIMQKALSLYLDNGMFDKNVSYLRQVFQKQINKAEQLLMKFSYPNHYTISSQNIILEIPSTSHMGNLDFSSQINYLENNYIDHLKKNIVQIPNDENLSNNISLITKK